MGVVPQGLRVITEVLGALFGDHEDDEVRCWVTSDLRVVALSYLLTVALQTPGPILFLLRGSSAGKVNAIHATHVHIKVFPLGTFAISHRVLV